MPANRRQFVVAQNSVRSLLQPEQILHSLIPLSIPRLFKTLPHHYILRRSLNVVLLEHRTIAPQSRLPCPDLVCTDVGDALPPRLDQVLCCKLANLEVVGSHKVRIQIREVAIDCKRQRNYTVDECRAP
jgi:hypothetical protein